MEARSLLILSAVGIESTYVDICTRGRYAAFCPGCPRIRDEFTGWKKVKAKLRRNAIHNVPRREIKLGPEARPDYTRAGRPSRPPTLAA
ncbi:MAG TPA: DUF1289 domain-containing protein [Paraburkholderia sp.]|nr:DUF1289 domain-containing protein [Paraburkholderia sp.]